MVATFGSMKQEDFDNVGTVLSSISEADSYSLLNSSVYSNQYEKFGYERSLADAHVRKVLRLAVPTFNEVLGRSSCDLLRKMLNIPKGLWEKIFNFTYVFDVDKEQYLKIDDTLSDKKYLYGPQIAEYLIDKLNIEEELERCIYVALSSVLREGVDPRSIFHVNKNKEGMLVAGGYYAKYSNEELLGGLKRHRQLSNVQKETQQALLPNSDSRFTYLLNMPKDKSGLYGMLNYNITIVPKEMRPAIDNREHRLTKLYTRVIKANYEMESNLNNSSPQVIQASYLKLNRYVSQLQYKRQVKGSGAKPDDLALLERIKSKTGQIRMNNFGKRQDYSGRAVVCINPYLPLDVIRVPWNMLPKLLEYHILPYLADNIRKNNYRIKMNEHVVNVYDKLQLGNLDTPEARAEMLRIINEEHLLDKIPFMMGRQPTLHRQSIQGFRVEGTDNNAIEVSPLVCQGYNMDFDGDQAWIRVPLLRESIEEVFKLAMPTQNLFFSKTGECTSEPRQDMIYGLWMCTNDSYVVGNPVRSYETYVDVRYDVINNKIKVHDTITVIESGLNMTAGDAAFLSCFPSGEIAPRGKSNPHGGPSVCQIDKTTITAFIDYILRVDGKGNFVRPLGTGYATTDTFVGILNALVELGFRVARLYPANVSMLVEHEEDPEYDNAVDKFHEDMEEIDMLYDLGLEVTSNYKIEFARHLDVLNNTRRSRVKDKLGKNSGYVKLAVSGARGSVDNLLQSFSIKGQVKKNETEAFDALLENSYASQLTPMEHFVAQYGGRQGQIDKSLKTGDTGYAMRQMWHASQGMIITEDDCGTNKGITISKSDLVVFSDADDAESVNKDVKSIFVHTLVGRYRVGDSKLITKEEATAMADDPSVTSVTIRSPLTCSNPCCSKCYGIDWGTHKKVIPGVLAGVIAAQSIGEPGTQLTMKTFHKGGVVSGKQDVTSAFDKVNRYIHVDNIAEMSKTGKYGGYDPVAWATGKVEEELSSDLNSKVVRIEGCKRTKITVPKSTVLKSHVHKGEGISYKHGDYDINELLAYGDIEDDKGNLVRTAIETAQLYLMFKLYTLYKNEVNIKTVHFEVLVASMTRYMIVDTDRTDLMVGQYATTQELNRGSLSNTVYIPRLIGVKDLPNASHDALDAIIMEHQVRGLSRICLLGMKDRLVKPLNRMLLAKTINEGSALPGFTERHTERI